MPISLRPSLTIIVALFLLSAMDSTAAGQAPKAKAERAPTAAEVAQLLVKEPISLATWPAWRSRLSAWMGDRSRNPEPAFDAARVFLKSEYRNGEFPPALKDDALAWYLLASTSIREIAKQGDAVAAGKSAEKALRRSLQLDPNFARAHARLGLALLLQTEASARQLPNPLRDEAMKELEQAQRKDPSLSVKETEAVAAILQGRMSDAERLFLQALAAAPDNADLAEGAAAAFCQNMDRNGPIAPAVKALCDRFPSDGTLVCYHAVALARDHDVRGAAREIDRARQLGAEPEKILPPNLVHEIERVGAPSALERFVWPFAWAMLYFAAFYAVVMLTMAFVGLVLASRTQGTDALSLLGVQPDELVTEGQVHRAGHESALAKLYGLSLFFGLVLFYVAIPFIIAGLLGVTGLLLYLTFMLGHIPIKLLIVIFFVGFGGAWAVLKSAFHRPQSGGFGIKKTGPDCPRLYATLEEVARRVDTDPVDEVYLAPGSSVSVHQEGRGPFGLLGAKKRVLTLGVATMNFLSINELKSVLAHEYAHFSHRDTFYSRFIYQVHMSIESALHGMGQSGGYYNYVNPFFWFLYLYYKAYSLLAAGYSRSREFLADRMACSLYGSDVFSDALTKVCTDGQLFESTMYLSTSKLLDAGRADANVYEEFRQHCGEPVSENERQEIYDKLLDEKASVFASHPTFRERLDAVSLLPHGRSKDTTSAVQLFENPEAVERELSEFMMSWMAFLKQAQAQPAKA
jgi:Zn-dependent protease with chaperone function